MLPEERIAVLIFLITIGAVYVFAIGTLIRTALEKFGKVDRPQGKVRIWFRRLIFGLAITGIGCVLYGYFIEPYKLTVRRVALRSEKLPKNSAPIRIVHISDLHSDPSPRLESELPEAIAWQNPDIVVFSGDSLNSPQ